MGLTASPCAGNDFFDTLIKIKSLMKLSGLNFKMPQKNIEELEKYTNNHHLNIIELKSTNEEIFIIETLEIIKNDQIENNNMVVSKEENNLESEETFINSSNLIEVLETYLESFQDFGKIPLKNGNYSQDICFEAMKQINSSDQISQNAKKKIEKKYEFFTSSTDTYYKKDKLMDLLKEALNEENPKIIIFVKRKICAKMLFDLLKIENFGNKIKPTLVIGHGKGMSSNKQMSSVQEFRENCNLM